MSILKIVLLVILGIILFIGMLFLIGAVDLQMMKTFGTRKENVRRDIFENTKSYVHGKTQDLAKYYEEHGKANDDGSKIAIENLIKMNFAEFDAEKLQSLRLKAFLIQIRGY